MTNLVLLSLVLGIFLTLSKCEKPSKRITYYTRPDDSPNIHYIQENGQESEIEKLTKNCKGVLVQKEIDGDQTLQCISKCINGKLFERKFGNGTVVVECRGVVGAEIIRVRTRCAADELMSADGICRKIWR